MHLSAITTPSGKNTTTFLQLVALRLHIVHYAPMLKKTFLLHTSDVRVTWLFPASLVQCLCAMMRSFSHRHGAMLCQHELRWIHTIKNMTPNDLWQQSVALFDIWSRMLLQLFAILQKKSFLLCTIIVLFPLSSSGRSGFNRCRENDFQRLLETIISLRPGWQKKNKFLLTNYPNFICIEIS